MHFPIHQIRQYKFYTIIVVIFITIQLACNCLVQKPIILFNSYLPVSAIIFTINYCLGDIVAEVYGYKFARQQIWLDIFCQYVFAFLLTVGIHTKSPTFWHNQSAYDTVFGPMTRHMMGSIFSTFASFFVNAYLISKLKIFMQGKRFWLRYLVAALISEGTLVIFSYTINFIGLYDASKILHFILTAWVLKIIVSLILTIPTALLVKILKRSENLDTYDIHTNFNPFSIKINEDT